MALFPEKASRHGFVAVWILGGIARQIGFDAKSGVLSARNLFKSWMKTKWQQLPAPIRADLFHVAISVRAAWKGARHTGRTFKHGAQMGVIEGQHRHRERQELREMNRDFPGRRKHPHYEEKLAQIKAARAERWTDHQVRATEIRLTARKGEKPDPLPLRVPPKTEDPTRPTVSDPVRSVSASNAGIPRHPGEPVTSGDWQVTYTAADGTQQVFDNRTREHAEQESQWWVWRKDRPHGRGGSIVVEPMPDRLEKFRGPGGALHFGRAADDPHGAHHCSQCSGERTTQDSVCPSCATRSDLRKADWNQRNSAEQVVNPDGCTHCAHNH